MVRSRRHLGCIRPKLQRSFAPTHTPMVPAHDAVLPCDTLVCPRHGLGHIRPKLRRSFVPMHALMAPTHVPRTRVVPWCICALALVALGQKSATSARSHTLYGAPAQAHFQGVLGPQLHGAPARLPYLLLPKINRKRKQVASKRKEKLTTPPTQKSPRLAGIPPSPPPNSPKSVLKSSKLLVLALAVDALNPHLKAVENTQASVIEKWKTAKAKKTARISVKSVRQRFSQRIIAKGGPSRPKPKKVEVINLKKEEDPEYKEEEEDPEESVEAEEIPSSWCLLAPSTTSSERGDDRYDDPHHWDFDEDLDDWDADVGGGDHDVELASAEGSEGSCPSPSSSAD
ncbi:hypothetical protein PIB30_067802 [Stylosanthes scabra]|uniref:Uncharacterized protein n=1 Tax=Stylosanthes scabra TaxID=79078 RepID=A0ABU6YK99_9FABA|nr:hypothetical protein [Stylosanthes scabra]